MPQPVLELLIFFDLPVGRFQLFQGGHQRLRNELPAKVPKAAPLVGQACLIFYDHWNTSGFSFQLSAVSLQLFKTERCFAMDKKSLIFLWSLSVFVPALSKRRHRHFALFLLRGPRNTLAR